MGYSKTFPRKIEGSNLPHWEEINLTESEEKEVEERCGRENYLILDQSLKEAKSLAIKNGINDDGIVSQLGVALFEKKSSHVVFWKEQKAKEKFDQQFKK